MRRRHQMSLRPSQLSCPSAQSETGANRRQRNGLKRDRKTDESRKYKHDILVKVFQPLSQHSHVRVVVMCTHIIRLEARECSDFARVHCAKNVLRSHSLRTILHILRSHTRSLSSVRVDSILCAAFSKQHRRLAEMLTVWSRCCTRVMGPKLNMMEVVKH